MWISILSPEFQVRSSFAHIPAWIVACTTSPFSLMLTPRDHSGIRKFNPNRALLFMVNVILLVSSFGYFVSCVTLTCPLARLQVSSDGTYKLTYRLESSW